MQAMMLRTVLRDTADEKAVCPSITPYFMTQNGEGLLKSSKKHNKKWKRRCKLRPQKLRAKLHPPKRIRPTILRAGEAAVENPTTVDRQRGGHQMHLPKISNAQMLQLSKWKLHRVTANSVARSSRVTPSFMSDYAVKSPREYHC